MSLVDQTVNHVEPQAQTLYPGENIPLAQLVDILGRRKWLLAVLTLLGAAASTAVALLLPVMYTAEAVIMPPPQQQSIAAGLLGQLGGVASLGARDLGIKSPSDIYIGIAKSRSVADAIITRFQLQTLYNKKTLVETRQKLAKRTDVASGKDTLIKIDVEDADPKRAADMANAFVEELYQQNTRLALTESSQRRLFFEQELNSEKELLANTESALKNTQQQTGMLQVNTQVEVAIRAMAQLRAEIVAREVSLKRLNMGVTDKHPEVIQLNAELTGMRDQLRKLEQARSRPGDPLIPTAKIPEIGLDYVRHLRDLQYHETLFELLAKQYEAAKIDEAKEAPVIQIVDKAVPPDQKSWPPRAVLATVGTLVTFLLSSVLLLLLRGRAAGQTSAASFTL